MLTYIACLCPNLVSVHFYAIPTLHLNFLFVKSGGQVRYTNMYKYIISKDTHTIQPILYSLRDVHVNAYSLCSNSDHTVEKSFDKNP